jgi:hypothetical protein
MIVDGKEIEKELVLNEDNMDDCIDKQSGYVSYYGKKWAYAEAKHRDTKINLDSLYATLDIQLRTALGTYTEGKIRSSIITDLKYIKKQEELSRYKLELDKLMIILKALDHKKDMIREKVKMINMDYNSSVNQKQMDSCTYDRNKERADKAERIMLQLKGTTKKISTKKLG